MIREFILKVRRAETPFYRRLKNIAKAMRTARLPLPKFVHPVLRMGYHMQHSLRVGRLWCWNRLYREPLFRGRCERIGKNFQLSWLPYVIGHAEIYIGDDVAFHGEVSVFSGRIFDHPTLSIGDRVNIGHGVLFIVNKEIVVEESAFISSGVRVMDTDSHPRDAEARIAGLPPFPEEIKPVRICKYAWIGERTYIMKGVTVGEGAIIGVNSVVVTDIPPYTIAMGNPARVVSKGGLKPAAQAGMTS